MTFIGITYIVYHTVIKIFHVYFIELISITTLTKIN